LRNNLFESTSKAGGVRQNTSDPTEVGKHSLPSRGRIVEVYGFATLLALVLFYLHVMVIFDVLGELLQHKAWMLEHLGLNHTGKTILLVSFFTLMLAHIAESAVWGLFFRWKLLMPSVTEGLYFTAASITTLGYGDILLKHPWRHLGTLIAITGVLMFGCSAAFLFSVMQAVWQSY
jgi:hypothetical protein